MLVTVGDTASDGTRADAFQGMMSSGNNLVRFVQLIVVDRLILQSRDEVDVQIVSRRSTVYQHLRTVLLALVPATGDDAT